ncbi:endonuclease III [bacterium]|nr:endonuclease III [bacterium]
MQKKEEKVNSIIMKLRKLTIGMTEPAGLTIIQEYGKDSFLILIACLLSLRTKDTISLPVSRQLFKYAQTPQQLIALPIDLLEQIVYKTGFYRQKAKTLRFVSQELITRFGGIVPKSEDQLLSIKGIGRKTANLVRGEAFGIPSICVDIHVHRISNRLGLVKSLTPEKTEQQLKNILPRKYWIEWNRLLVMWGQNICKPLSPFCSQCSIADQCPKIGVKKSR